jgi:hypothetical protein
VGGWGCKGAREATPFAYEAVGMKKWCPKIGCAFFGVVMMRGAGGWWSEIKTRTVGVAWMPDTHTATAGAAAPSLLVCLASPRRHQTKNIICDFLPSFLSSFLPSFVFLSTFGIATLWYTVTHTRTQKRQRPKRTTPPSKQTINGAAAAAAAAAAAFAAAGRSTAAAGAATAATAAGAGCKTAGAAPGATTYSTAGTPPAAAHRPLPAAGTSAAAATAAAAAGGRAGTPWPAYATAAWRPCCARQQPQQQQRRRWWWCAWWRGRGPGRGRGGLGAWRGGGRWWHSAAAL